MLQFRIETQASPRLERLKEFRVEKQDLQQAGTLITDSIKRNTVQGRDAFGRAFRPYSPAYALFRKEHGRQASKVDLCFTGNMLGSMTHVITNENRLEVTFKGSKNQEKAKNLFRGGRNFFAISQETKQTAGDMILRSAMERFNG